MQATFGHLRQRALLCDGDINESVNDSSVVVQFSSLGSIQPKWLSDLWLRYLRTDRVFARGRVKITDCLELVLPTMVQMADGSRAGQLGAHFR